MNQKFVVIMLLFSMQLFVYLPIAYAETIKQNMDGGVEIQIKYPESVIVGRDFSISFLVENNGWEDKQDVSFVIDSPDNSIFFETKEIMIDRLSTEGNYGNAIDFQISKDAAPGTHFLNVVYTQTLLENNEKPLEPVSSNIAIPIIVKEQPKVTIHTITPESIFTNAEFPFIVELTSEDIDLQNVNVQIVAPDEINFRGETMHTFSSVQKGTPLSISSQIITPQEEIITEHRIPFEVIVTYVDDTGEEKTDSQTVSLLLRPRTFMELTTDGGVWIGDFFLAPYVSVGTIIGIPAGALLSLAIRRSQKKKKNRKVRKK